MLLDRKMSLPIDKDILGKTKAEPLSTVTRNYSITKVMPKLNQIIKWRQKWKKKERRIIV